MKVAHEKSAKLPFVQRYNKKQQTCKSSLVKEREIYCPQIWTPESLEIIFVFDFLQKTPLSFKDRCFYGYPLRSLFFILFTNYRFKIQLLRSFPRYNLAIFQCQGSSSRSRQHLSKSSSTRGLLIFYSASRTVS